MTQVSMDKDLAVDLINEKLRSINHEIDLILQKWNYNSIELFLENTKSGKLRNAEDDAIVLENLLDDHKDFGQLKKKWDLSQ